MTWPAPRRSECLARVEPTTYAWGWAAFCCCMADWSTYGNPDTARDAAHSFACRCELAKRRLTNHRRAVRA